ncbi:HsdM family class I SAM-dependent methyltransferase [Stigmatella hybrida]|uniref:HsdM family class I SAM-dependent methyltransferase n=1 Tax=Stigmatella hybrida TaxID=394097 RepID=UPI001CDA970D|nr:N-6 DNA methylase [Stigmatella hybrida]
MLLDDAHQTLGWPERGQVLTPKGEGPKVYADFTKRKIGAELQRKYPAVQVHTGILATDPDDDATVAPLAVVCEFPSGAPEEVLLEAHRLAWNFSRTALLITLEPHRLIAWSCCQPPRDTVADLQVCTFERGQPAQESIRWMLHRVGLVTGRILQKQPEKFSSDGRADATLLANLKVIRAKLLAANLPMEHCHDLLARVIFTQFLFHRRDRDGRPFFDRRLLENRCDGTLKRVHTDLASILQDKRETYALFRWLDDRFNGDLFPGKDGQSEAERKHAWHAEEEAVTEGHLTLLADLVSGRIVAQSQQFALWPLYSFDVIPLEFISSVYEEFLGDAREGHKAYYTPTHLVDYVLDAVLPWNSDEWNIKVLDPSCGSGIFLVKAFQRIIHRWRRAHDDRDPLVSDLKPILEQNLVGVDKHPEAVRVACFSLYLAMADAIEPRYYLKRDKVFPRLRGTNLLARDFFDETTDGIRTKDDVGTYDLVLGNAPWGDKSIETSSTVDEPTSGSRRLLTLAQVWAKKCSWPVVNSDLGPLFLAKGAALVREGGSVAMIQSASVLNLRNGEANALRRKLFETFTFDEVTNLSIVRDKLFSGAFGPSAVMVFRRAAPNSGQTLLYLCPKPLHDPQSQYRIVIDPQDVHRITHAEAAQLPQVWSTLLLGGRRDLSLVLRLSRLPTLAKLKERGEVKVRQGVIPGNRKRVLDGRVVIQKRGSKETKVVLPDLRDVHYFEAERFPDEAFLHLNQRDVPTWDDPRVADTDSTDFGAFRPPQMLIKGTYSRKDARMRAVRVRATVSRWGVFCKKTYTSVCDLKGEGQRLDAACVAFNSTITTWYLALTSSRLGHNRPEVLVRELLDVPLPEKSADLRTLKTFDDVDACAAKLFGLTEADMVLVEDCVQRTLPQAQHETALSGYLSTRRNPDPADDDPGIVAYANCILRVLRGTFGPERKVSATVYEEAAGSERLPVRMVAIHLDGKATATVAVEAMTAEGLMDSLRNFYEQTMRTRARERSGEGFGVQRVAFLFDRRAGELGLRLYIVKPDQRRYWTRSLALHDADQISSAILMGAERAGGDE